MADDELERIRQARLQELAARGSPGNIASAGGNGDVEAQKRQEDEARKSIISQILTPEATDRLGRIAMVKAEKARDLENRLIMMARTGQLPGRVTEEQLIQLINAGQEAEKKEETKITFSRRKGIFDNDDDDW